MSEQTNSLITEESKQLEATPSQSILQNGTTISGNITIFLSQLNFVLKPGYFSKKIKETICPRTKDGISKPLDLVIQIANDEIQLIIIKDGIYYEGKEQFLSEGDIVNIVNQIPFMSENENFSLILRYEGFPPIYLVKSNKKASDIEKNLMVNATNLQVNILLHVMFSQPEEFRTTEQLNDAIQIQYERDLRERYYYYRQYRDDLQADILQIQSEIKQMNQNDSEGLKTQKYRLDIIKKESSKLDYYREQWTDKWKNCRERISQVQYLRMMHSFATTDSKIATYKQQRNQYDQELLKLFEDIRRARGPLKNQKATEQVLQERKKELGQKYLSLEKMPFFQEDETCLEHRFLNVDEIPFLNEEIKKLKQEIAGQKALVKQKKEQLKKQQNKIYQLNKNLEEKDEQINNYLNQIKELKEQNKKLEESAAETTKFKQKYDQIVQLMKTMQQKHQERIENLENLICLKEKQIKEVKQQNTSINEQIELITKAQNKDEKFKAYQIDLSKNQESYFDLLLQIKRMPQIIG